MDSKLNSSWWNIEEIGLYSNNWWQQKWERPGMFHNTGTKLPNNFYVDIIMHNWLRKVVTRPSRDRLTRLDLPEKVDWLIRDKRHSSFQIHETFIILIKPLKLWRIPALNI